MFFSEVLCFLIMVRKLNFIFRNSWLWLFRLVTSGYNPFNVLKMFFLKIPDSILHILCLMPQSEMKPKQMTNGRQILVKDKKNICKSLRLWWEKAEFKFGFFTWVQKSLLASALLLMPHIWLHMTEVESAFYPLQIIIVPNYGW